MITAHGVRVVILIGVSGSGKTRIGQLLATNLNWPFYDGDDFHPKANVEKMSRGIPLTDEDRASWLTTLEHLIRDLTAEGRSAVLSCSALKQTYRDRLVGNRDDVVLVYLKGDYDLVRHRLLERKDHFMKANLLASQFDTLEEPVDVLAVDSAQEPEVIVNEIKQRLGLSHT